LIRYLAMISPPRGPEVWKYHPYLGLLLCLAVGGGFWYGVVESLVQGSYRWGRGSGATINTRVHDPVAFWLGTLLFASVATFFLVLGFAKFKRRVRRAR
jgi:hypothetical protein